MRRLALSFAISLALLAGCKQAAQAPDASVATPAAADAAPAAFAFEEASIASLQQQMASGAVSSHALTRAYLDRIAAVDDAGPMLNAVIETNPDALKQADALDAERKAGKLRGPLHGIPVLLKDNIDAVPMVNSAGSLALANHRPKTDAFLVAKLRAAGAVRTKSSTTIGEFTKRAAPALPAPGVASPPTAPEPVLSAGPKDLDPPPLGEHDPDFVPDPDPFNGADADLGQVDA